MKDWIKRSWQEIKVSIGLLCLFSLQVSQRILMDEADRFYANKIGLPVQWLSIYSDTGNRNLWSLLFEGNRGIFVNIGALLGEFFLIFLLVKSIFMLVKYIKSRTVKVKGLVQSDKTI